VDEAWLSTDIAQTRSGKCVPEFPNGEWGRERQIMQAALAESGSRVYGANGAAAKIRIPPSTLDYKIKKLQISKSRVKFC
jgi:transcriptional regulator with GAF, ATPase, and Fis domain